MRRGRKRILWILSLAVLLLGVGCSGDTADVPAPFTILTIGTADVGGTMYPVGRALAQTLSGDDVRVNVASSTGSVMNIRSILSGEVDLGLVAADAAYLAANDADAPAEGLRAIAAVYTSASNWIAPASLGITYVHELASGRVGIGPENSLSAKTARLSIDLLALEEHAVKAETCSLKDGAERLERGELKAFHGFVGVPSDSMVQLSEQFPCTLLEYTEEELEQILGSGGFYFRTWIPSGTYAGQTQDVATFGTKCLLCVDASMEEELAYAITCTLWENTAELEARHGALSAMRQAGFLWDELPIPLHDGAARFYRENCADFPQMDEA